MQTGRFDLLTPDAVIPAVEEAAGVQLDGSMQRYPSYVNRVYGLKDEDGAELIAKFYRPARWSAAALLDEHRFLLDLAQADIPVAAPIPDDHEETLHAVEVSDEEGNTEVFHFALFQKRGGRSFDAETDDQWYRLGSLIGRCHAVGIRRTAEHRIRLSPTGVTAGYVKQLLDDGLVIGEATDEFASVCRETIERITPLFDGVPHLRIHGDCHRGNILDRPDTGLVLFDFDDMMNGPAVQDLWLLLPDYADRCTREVTMLLDGYEQFVTFDRRTLSLIEPLRFMRMIYFLAWRAAQLNDHWFRESHPDWGSEAFWIKEVEDLRTQALVIARG